MNVISFISIIFNKFHSIYPMFHIIYQLALDKKLLGFRTESIGCLLNKSKLKKIGNNVRGDIFFQLFVSSSFAYLLALSIRNMVLVKPCNFLLLKTINLSLFNMKVLYYFLLFILRILYPPHILFHPICPSPLSCFRCLRSPRHLRDLWKKY